MPRFFTHYWNNDTWYSNRDTWYSNRGSERDTCNHTAGNMFRKRKVAREDFIYIVTVEGGQLFLGGRMQVNEIISRDQAIELLGHDDLWEAEDQVIAIPGTGTAMRFDRIVPMETVERLRCVNGNDEKGLAFRTPTELDGQTLRGVRELTPESARILDALIESSDPPGRNPDHSSEDHGLGGRSGNDTTEEQMTIGTVTAFDPSNIEDERSRKNQAIVQRLGQSGFRKALLLAYDGRCAVSGFGVERTLQAAHIISYMGETTNHVSNGLLLRADLHNLFDSFLLSIDPETFTVHIALGLRDTPYGELSGKKIALPAGESLRPNRDALKKHFDVFEAYEFARNEITEEELERARNSPGYRTTAEVLAYLHSL
jgi:hypothetical protein